MTSAVTNPPKTWQNTVASAQNPKFPNNQVGALGSTARMRGSFAKKKDRMEKSGNNAARNAGGRLKRVS